MSKRRSGVRETSVESSTSTVSTSTDTTTTTSESAASSTAVAPATPAARNACAMVSAEELKTATGIDGEGSTSSSGGADVCTWFGSTGKAAIVQLYPYASSYDGSRKAFEDLYKVKAEELSSVGDKAFSIWAPTGSMPTTSLSAVKGSAAISVQIMGNSDAAASKKEAVALANLVLGKL